jgi:hypothetical protein
MPTENTDVLMPLVEELNTIKEDGCPMFEKSYNARYGVLITGNQAQAIVNHCRAMEVLIANYQNAFSQINLNLEKCTKDILNFKFTKK